MRTTFLSFFVTCLTLASGCSEDAQNLGGLGPSGAAGASGGQTTGGTSGGQTQATGGTSGGQTQATGGTSGGQTQATGGTGQAAGGGEVGGTGQAAGGFAQGGTGQATGGGPAGGQGGASQAGGYAARFVFRSGQETVGDFCVIYKDTADSTWASARLLESNGLKASDFDGFERMTRYVPLQGPPEMFGFVYPGQPCSEAHGWQTASADPMPEGYDHFTVVALPYSGEPITVWAVGDRAKENAAQGDAAVGVRVVNASLEAGPISVTLKGGGEPGGPLESVTLPNLPFNNAPTSYVQFSDPSNSGLDRHLHHSDVTDTTGTATIDWTTVDLLSLSPPRTLYITGSQGKYRALACVDTTATEASAPQDTPCLALGDL
ncbi:MAG: hypothetical protein EOO75_08820 [Myxococcales bacterium]|nr:MAG: hypothetical protein EOO75_08820 [Myxococcales bacterium]